MTAAATLELLECAVVRATIGIPRAAVAQLIEYELAPLPVPARYVGGLGLHAGEIVLSIALTPALGQGRRRTRGVLLRSADGTGRWCVEVTGVARFATATLFERDGGDGAAAAAPRWLRRALLAGRRTVIALDADAMIADLSAGGPS